MSCEPNDRAPDHGRESLRGLLVQQLPAVRSAARRLCGTSHELDDLVHDVFEKALRLIDTVDPARNPRGWMITLLRHLHVDRCRERARRRSGRPCDDLPMVEPEARPPWRELTIDDVRCAASRLPDELRAPYVMFALERRSYVDIAAALGIPKSTVGTRVLRARARLRSLLSDELDGSAAPGGGIGYALA